jgi:hypothetical protein
LNSGIDFDDPAFGFKEEDKSELKVFPKFKRSTVATGIDRHRPSAKMHYWILSPKAAGYSEPWLS